MCYQLADFCRRHLGVKAAENQTEEFLVPWLYSLPLRASCNYFLEVDFRSRSKLDFSVKM